VRISERSPQNLKCKCILHAGNSVFMNVKRKICHITYNLTKCCIETEYRQAVSRKVSVKFLQETATEVKKIFYICSAKPKKLRILHYVSKI